MCPAGVACPEGKSGEGAEQEGFFMFPRHQELLGDRARDCGLVVTLEYTGMEAETRGIFTISYLLYRSVCVCVCVCERSEERRVGKV